MIPRGLDAVHASRSPASRPTDPSGAPAALSRPIIQGLLRGQLNFRGVTITDALGAPTGHSRAHRRPAGRERRRRHPALHRLGSGRAHGAEGRAALGQAQRRQRRRRLPADPGAQAQARAGRPDPAWRSYNCPRKARPRRACQRLDRGVPVRRTLTHRTRRAPGSQRLERPCPADRSPTCSQPRRRTFRPRARPAARSRSRRLDAARAGTCPPDASTSALVVVALTDRRALAADPVDPELRPVGVDRVGPRDRPPQPPDHRRPVVEAAADDLHRPVRAVRQRRAEPVAGRRARGRVRGGGDGVPAVVPAHAPDRQLLHRQRRPTSGQFTRARAGAAGGADRRRRTRALRGLHQRQRARLLRGPGDGADADRASSATSTASRGRRSRSGSSPRSTGPRSGCSGVPTGCGCSGRTPAPASW